MNIRRKQRSIGTVISLASMADIAFLLLIFFVVTSSIGRSDVDDVTLPEAESPPVEESAGAFTVKILPNGEIYYRDARIDTVLLDTLLDEAAAEGAFPGQVRIIGDTRMPYAHIAPVLAVLREAGVRQVIFLASLRQEAVE